MLLTGAARPGSHPIHTTYAELSQAGTGQPIRLEIRGFLDDLTAAARLREPLGATDSVVARYLVARVRVIDRRGRLVTWRVRHTSNDGEVFRLTVEGGAGMSLSGGSVLSAPLTEFHADQVNLVRVVTRSRSSTLLFSRGDGFRRLPT